MYKKIPAPISVGTGRRLTIRTTAKFLRVTEPDPTPKQSKPKAQTSAGSSPSRAKNSTSAVDYDALMAKRKAQVDRYVSKADLFDEDGQYKGSTFNVLTLLLLVAVLTPIVGLIIAYFTFGTLWG